MVDLLRRDVLSARCLRELPDLVSADADGASKAALADLAAVDLQLTDAKRRLGNLYRAIQRDDETDLPRLAPRLREVKGRVDELTAKHARLATAATPVVRLADEATITRRGERLRAVLATGSPATQRTFLWAWIARIEADGMKLAVASTIPGDLCGRGGDGLQVELDASRFRTMVEPRRYRCRRSR